MKITTFALIPMMAAFALSAGAATAEPNADRKAKMEQRAQKHMEKVDTNKDGNISREEATAAAMKRFDRMDLNGDGQITPQERQDMKAKYKAERKAKRAAKPAS